MNFVALILPFRHLRPEADHNVSVVLRACHKADQWQHALAVFFELPKQGIVADRTGAKPLGSEVLNYAFACVLSNIYVKDLQVYLRKAAIIVGTS